MPTPPFTNNRRPRLDPNGRVHDWAQPVAPFTTQQFAPELMASASLPGAPEPPLAWDTREPTWLQRGGPSQLRARVASQEGVVSPSPIQLDDLGDAAKLSVGLPKMAAAMMGKGPLMAAGGAGLAALLKRQERAGAADAAGDYMAHRAPMAVPEGPPLPDMPPPGFPSSIRGWRAHQQGGYPAVIEQWEKDQRIQRWLADQRDVPTAGPGIPRPARPLPDLPPQLDAAAPLPDVPVEVLPPMPPTPAPAPSVGNTTNPGRVRRRSP